MAKSFMGEDSKRSASSRTALLLSLVALIVTATAARLGLWQLERADAKRQVLAAFELAPEHELQAVFWGHPELRYARVVGRGRYASNQHLLLDNQTHEGQPGYRVLTPFRTEHRGAARFVLVERGWIPRGWRDQGVELDLPILPTEIRGRLDELPRPGLELEAPPPPADEPWPKVRSFPTMDDLVVAYDGMELPWGIVRLDAGHPGCFACGFEPVSFPPERHLAYAIQWFALAATTIIIWAVLLLRWRRRVRDRG